MFNQTGATLSAHAGAHVIERAELVRIPAPEATRTWRPVAHAELVDTLTAELATRGLTIRREQYAVMREGAVLFAAYDLTWLDNGQYAAALALRHANDKTLAVSIAVGVRVFICDNLVLSGDVIVMRRKHTSGLVMAAELTAALDRYKGGMKVLTDGIGRLEATPLSDEQAKVRIFDAFEREILPMRHFPAVVDNYFEHGFADCAERTAWCLHNAFTREIRALNPAPAYRATVELGRLFGLGRQGELAS